MKMPADNERFGAMAGAARRNGGAISEFLLPHER